MNGIFDKSKCKKNCERIGLELIRNGGELDKNSGQLERL